MLATSHAAWYHSFKFVLVNYILEGKMIPEPKLWKTKLMINCYLVDRQYEPETGRGKFKDGILIPIEVRS